MYQRFNKQKIINKEHECGMSSLYQTKTHVQGCKQSQLLKISELLKFLLESFGEYGNIITVFTDQQAKRQTLITKTSLN